MLVPQKDQLELYRMEYDLCVSSYQSIHEAIWRIFSYLSAISAALLLFGSQYLSMDAAILAAVMPLLFWFWCVYLPMDRYGHKRSERLAEIEDILNDTFKVNLAHFRLFRNRPRLYRVRYRVCTFAVLATLGLLYFLIWGVPKRFVKVKESVNSRVEVEVKNPVQIESRVPTSAPSPQPRLR